MKDKLQVINDSLIQTVNDMVVDSVAKVKTAECKELLTKIDEFDKNDVELSKNLYDLRKQNNKLEDALPEMDKQIEMLEAAMAKFEGKELTADTIVNDVMTP